jgi:adenylosuccinate synthase
VLSGLDKVPICVAYDVDGERTEQMPGTQTGFHHASPVYEYLEGWAEDISAARSFGDLPPAAQVYVRRIEELAGAQVSVVGVGPGRDENVVLHDLLD